MRSESPIAPPILTVLMLWLTCPFAMFTPNLSTSSIFGGSISTECAGETTIPASASELMIFLTCLFMRSRGEVGFCAAGRANARLHPFRSVGRAVARRALILDIRLRGIREDSGIVHEVVASGTGDRAPCRVPGIRRGIPAIEAGRRGRSGGDRDRRGPQRQRPAANGIAGAHLVVIVARAASGGRIAQVGAVVDERCACKRDVGRLIELVASRRSTRPRQAPGNKIATAGI